MTGGESLKEIAAAAKKLSGAASNRLVSSGPWSQRIASGKPLTAHYRLK
jgi:hypothetical protein